MKISYQIIPRTKNTPEVILDPQGIIKLSGRLIPENADVFFDPVKKWIDEYFCDPADYFSLEIRLEYINSVGAKYLLDILECITHFHLRDNVEKYAINWYYEDFDEDMLEEGQLFSTNLNVPFNFIKISK